ncbi:MAG: DNA helicase RecQ [Phycisphaerales bacterium]
MIDDARVETDDTDDNVVATDARISDVVQRYWGYSTLRPMQQDAIRAGLEQRDSLVVLPTGGGKSLCYQVPPLLEDRVDVVVSPLIALMRDQVDGLLQVGYPAAAVHSMLSAGELDEVRAGIRERRYRLLFVSPERLMTDRFLAFLERQKITSFAIDEAHCISQWGHDFRQEYRMLATLKLRFPHASIHAYTATATPRVREDIIQQLSLRNPQVLVGRFDRANLTYRVLPALDVFQQTLEAVHRHAHEAVIVYCLSRRDTEALAEYLTSKGIKAAPYHAGLERAERTTTQDAFAREDIDVICATVAFGMGIDRSNVRCIVHATIPKSIEHYQQETGRAGRDGLPAECVMFYSVADVMRWERLIAFSAEKAPDPEPVIAAGVSLLRQMQGLCTTLECRHAALSRYFGQKLEGGSCDACDVCLNEVTAMPDSTDVARKILSCVYRVEQRFGIGHVVSVLRGSRTANICSFGHDQLSTFGILKGHTEKALTNLIYQLVDQGLLKRSEGDRPTISLSEGALDVLRGERDVKLIDPIQGIRKTESAEWHPDDERMFQHLRAIRKQIAHERSVPAFVIFSDATLRAIAQRRPATLDDLAHIDGIGKKKLADFGAMLITEIAHHCTQHNLQQSETTPRRKRKGRQQLSSSKSNRLRDEAINMLKQGQSIASISERTGRTEDTIWKYLAELIENDPPATIEPWVDNTTRQRVLQAARDTQSERLRPIFEALDEEIPYAVIRAVLTFAATKASALQ